MKPGSEWEVEGRRWRVDEKNYSLQSTLHAL
jgi:hypothetical protein